MRNEHTEKIELLKSMFDVKKSADGTRWTIKFGSFRVEYDLLDWKSGLDIVVELTEESVNFMELYQQVSIDELQILINGIKAIRADYESITEVWK